jgi:hypothetical protein
MKQLSYLSYLTGDAPGGGAELPGHLCYIKTNLNTNEIEMK